MVNRKGAILLIVLIVLLTISLLGACLMALFFDVLSSSQIELDRARALYLAEAGVAQGINTLKKQARAQGTTTQRGSADLAQTPGSAVVAPAKVSGGTFEVFTDFSQATIMAVGISNGVKRTVQLKYSAF